MVDDIAGAKARSWRDRRYGEQDSPDRLGRPHPRRTLHTPCGSLRRQEKRVSKTREMKGISQPPEPRKPAGQMTAFDRCTNQNKNVLLCESHPQKTFAAFFA